MSGYEQYHRTTVNGGVGTSTCFEHEDGGMYRPLQRKHYTDPCRIILASLVVCVLVLAGLMGGYYIRIVAEEDRSRTEPPKNEGTQCPRLEEDLQIPPRDLEARHKTMVDSISGKHMSQFIEKYAHLQIPSSSRLDKDIVDNITLIFRGLTIFNKIEVKKYDVLLSLPDPSNPNKVTIVEENGNITYKAPLYIEHKVAKEETTAETSTGTSQKKRETSSEKIQPFVTYTPAGKVQAELVYVHYGTSEDFLVAENMGIPLQQKIALIQLGKTPVLNKIQLATNHNISGVLLYWDPQDTSTHRCDNYVPFVAMETDGDPLTSGYPSNDGVWRMPLKDVQLPTIPVQTISCQTASYLMSRMSGPPTPKSWIGRLDVPYYFNNNNDSVPWEVSLEVNNQFHTYQPIYNVIATISGQMDPDEIVLVGANRNSFEIGSGSGAMGTAILLDLAKNFEKLLNAILPLWLPKRTLKLVSWGGGDFGNLGLEEFIEENKAAMARHTVTYIDLDSPFQGSENLNVAASAALHPIIYAAAQDIPSPNQELTSLFESWYTTVPKLTAGGFPVIQNSFTHGMYENPMLFQFGTSTIHVQYGKSEKHIPEKAIPSLAILDQESLKEWRHLESVGGLLAQLTLSFLDSDILPFNAVNCAKEFRIIVQTLSKSSHIPDSIFGSLITSSSHLIPTAEALHVYLENHLSFHQATQRRRVNERLLQFLTVVNKGLKRVAVIRNDLDQLMPLESTINGTSSENEYIHVTLRKELSLLLNDIHTAHHVLKLDGL